MEHMAMQRTNLQQLLDQGQSPWIDNITRDMFRTGELKKLVDQGVVGLTSNPSIFQKAIGNSKEYDGELQKLVRENKSVSDIYDDLVLDDIRHAAEVLRPVYDRTNGADGFVSIEVAPEMAYDTDKTLAEARRLWEHLNLPNIMVKIPGTPDGIPAFQHAISEGININVTLLFSLEGYRHVAEAYIEALTQRATAGKPVDGIASVASFFVSRVDTEVDKRLDALIGHTEDESKKQELRDLRGKAAIANAKMAYQAFTEIFSGPQWDALAAKGAKPQRCLWASTSTKNPAFPDTLYVANLIGPHTVDTMPGETIEAFLDHGTVARTIDADVDVARSQLRALEAAGISMDEVTEQLQRDGVELFADAFKKLVGTISQKRDEMMAHAG